MDDKILTIIVPSYNTSKYMDECLPYYLDKKLRKTITVLLIDDGATDDSYSKAKKYQLDYPDTFIAVHKDNGGHGSVINLGVEMTHTKYFKVIDGDDWPDTENLVALADYLTKCNDDIVISDSVGVFSDNKVLTKGANSDVQPFQSYSVDLINCFNPSIHRLTFKTEYYKSYNIQLSEKVFYEDTEYSLFFLDKLDSISYFNKTVYYYRQGNTEQSTAVSSLLKHFDDFKIVFNRVLEQLYSNKHNEALTSLFTNCLSGSIRLWYLLILNSDMSDKDKKYEIKKLTKKLKSNENLFRAVQQYKIIRVGLLFNFSPIKLFKKLSISRF